MVFAYQKHVTGSFSDIAIMTKKIDEEMFRTQKIVEDNQISHNDYKISELFQSAYHYNMLSNKVYQALNEIDCVLNHSAQ